MYINPLSSTFPILKSQKNRTSVFWIVIDIFMWLFSIVINILLIFVTCCLGFCSLYGCFVNFGPFILFYFTFCLFFNFGHIFVAFNCFCSNFLSLQFRGFVPRKILDFDPVDVKRLIHKSNVSL